MSQEFSFKLAFDDFDLGLLGETMVDRNSEDLGAKISEFFASQFQDFGGAARVIVNDGDQMIEVHWTKGTHWKEPEQLIGELLKQRRLSEALPVLWTYLQQHPEDVGRLYDLGVVYSEMGQLDKAIRTLEQVVERSPGHINAITALAVAEIHSGNLLIGEEWLTKALQIDPDNRWVLRNLSATLLKQGRFADAKPVLKHCLEVAPNDVNSIVGLAEAHERLGETDDASRLYKAAIEMGGPDQVIDIAKEGRSRLAAQRLKNASDFRADAMVYMQLALDRFAQMTPRQVQELALEIAVLGNQGLNINDPEKKYTLKATDGEFTGLHLISIMYAAFQQFAPQTDLGIDLSKEYAAAKGE